MQTLRVWMNLLLERDLLFSGFVEGVEVAHAYRAQHGRSLAGEFYRLGHSERFVQEVGLDL